VCGVVWLSAEGGHVKNRGGLAVGFLWGGRVGRKKKKKIGSASDRAPFSLSLCWKKSKFFAPPCPAFVFYSCFAPFLGNPLWTSTGLKRIEKG
jgi:hypothetical protein